MNPLQFNFQNEISSNYILLLLLFYIICILYEKLCKNIWEFTHKLTVVHLTTVCEMCSYCTPPWVQIQDAEWDPRCWWQVQPNPRSHLGRMVRSAQYKVSDIMTKPHLSCTGYRFSWRWQRKLDSIRSGLALNSKLHGIFYLSMIGCKDSKNFKRWITSF